MRQLFLGAAVLALLTGQPAMAQGNLNRVATPSASVNLDFSGTIPNVTGKSLKTVFVDYAPGGFSPARSHAKSAFILAYTSRPIQ